MTSVNAFIARPAKKSALAELMPVVYAELRRLGPRLLQRQRDQLVLRPSALVHEAWLRLTGRTRVSLVNRAQFCALASKIMRDVLVDHVRRVRATKRDGQVGFAAATAADSPRHGDFLMLDEALARLGDIKPRYAQVAALSGRAHHRETHGTPARVARNHRARVEDRSGSAASRAERATANASRCEAAIT